MSPTDGKAVRKNAFLAEGRRKPSSTTALLCGRDKTEPSNVLVIRSDYKYFMLSCKEQGVSSDNEETPCKQKVIRLNLAFVVFTLLSLLCCLYFLVLYLLCGADVPIGVLVGVVIPNRQNKLTSLFKFFYFYILV